MTTQQSMQFNTRSLGFNGPFSAGIQYSDQFGVLFNSSYTQRVNHNNAASLLFTIGNKEQRVDGSWGLAFNLHNWLKATAEYLRQDIDFNYSSGDSRDFVGQQAYGLTYQYVLQRSFLNAIFVNAFYSHADSRSLSSKIYMSDALRYLNLRHIAGGTDRSLNAGVDLLPSRTTLLGLALNYDNLTYDTRYISDPAQSGIGGTVNLEQLLSPRFKVQLQASYRQPFQNYTAGLYWLVPTAFSNRLQIGLVGSRFIGEHGLHNDSRIGLNFSYQWGFIHALKAILYHVAAISVDNNLATWTAKGAVHMPQVLAISDQRSILLPAPMQSKNAAKAMAASQYIPQKTNYTIPNVNANPDEKFELALNIPAHILFTVPNNPTYNMTLWATGLSTKATNLNFTYDKNTHVLTIYGHIPANLKTGTSYKVQIHAKNIFGEAKETQNFTINIAPKGIPKFTLDDIGAPDGLNNTQYHPYNVDYAINDPLSSATKNKKKAQNTDPSLRVAVAKDTTQQLPTGMYFDKTTLEGDPTINFNGKPELTYKVRIIAVNSAGSSSNEATLTVCIHNHTNTPLHFNKIDITVKPDGYVGDKYPGFEIKPYIDTQGTSTNLTVNYAGDTSEHLPTGMNFSGTKIVGTPADPLTADHTYNIKIIATDSAGSSDNEATLHFIVHPSLKPSFTQTQLPPNQAYYDAQYNHAFSENLKQYIKDPANDPGLKISLYGSNSGTLPTGLHFTGTSITGTPSDVSQEGHVFHVHIKATNKYGDSTNNAWVDIKISGKTPPTPHIHFKVSDINVKPDGYVGQAYPGFDTKSYIETTGTVSNLSINYASSTAEHLPKGMNFSGTKVVGTPTDPLTATHTYNIKVIALDTNGTSDNEATLHFIVHPDQRPTFTQTNLPPNQQYYYAHYNVKFTENLKQYIHDPANDPGLKISLDGSDSDALPTGLHFSGTTIEGTPTNASQEGKVFHLHIKATNKYGDSTNNAWVDLIIFSEVPPTPHIHFKVGNITVKPDAYVGEKYPGVSLKQYIQTPRPNDSSLSVTYAAGTAEYLPAGMHFEGTSIVGQPTKPTVATPHTYKIKVKAVDSKGASDNGATLTFTLQPSRHPVFTQTDLPPDQAYYNVTYNVNFSQDFKQYIHDPMNDSGLKIEYADNHAQNLPQGISFSGTSIVGTATNASQIGQIFHIHIKAVNSIGDSVNTAWVTLRITHSAKGMLSCPRLTTADIQGNTIAASEISSNGSTYTFSGNFPYDKAKVSSITFNNSLIDDANVKGNVLCSYSVRQKSGALITVTVTPSPSVPEEARYVNKNWTGTFCRSGGHNPADCEFGW